MASNGAASRKTKRIEIARKYLRQVGLAHVERSWPRELSGGMLKRVAVATVFANSPRVLLMDEPFAALDYVTKLQLHQLLLNLWGQYRPTVLFVTHDVNEAMLLADRIMVMKEGRVVDDRQISFGAAAHRRKPRAARGRRAQGSAVATPRARRVGARRDSAAMRRATSHRLVSVGVLVALAALWQLASILMPYESVPGEPMMPGWQIVVTQTFLSLADYWQGGLGVPSVSQGGARTYAGAALAVLSNSWDTSLRLFAV